LWQEGRTFYTPKSHLPSIPLWAPFPTSMIILTLTHRTFLPCWWFFQKAGFFSPYYVVSFPRT
jgi:hypothetical protein